MGQSISRPRKSKHVLKDQQREVIKERFRTGELTPWQYLNAMSNTIGGAVTLETGIELYKGLVSMNIVKTESS